MERAIVAKGYSAIGGVNCIHPGELCPRVATDRHRLRDKRGEHDHSRDRLILLVRLHQLDMADIKRLGQLVKGDDGWVPSPSFQAAQILLAEARARFDLLLCQASCPTQAGEIPADQLAHIHAQRVARVHTLSL